MKKNIKLQKKIYGTNNCTLYYCDSINVKFSANKATNNVAFARIAKDFSKNYNTIL